ncbi:hypothetical protein AUEXF2481DRAFT_5819 [Aureobasidium subglaciale EXF-2481]|uniref:Uncharacterized protein n=1 Tax=Aureobasidium subglaciale (strain EXF-2481) TaxID=1043005 RepID=A0A074YJQ5_AURSE|nr:uncharacterized protein AUEXF2481DRAFT_5819 [Aureobasidium subglaciale EXF-2481]KEQ94327.1 hypothetical protein AUEXF2481DRAFT_5819 [Aureobasidium subglaciale EXF-2481]
MAQAIPIPPTHTYSDYEMPPTYRRSAEVLLVDVVEGTGTGHEHRRSRNPDAKHHSLRNQLIQTTFHCWKLTKAVQKTKHGAPSWKRAERIQMTLPSDELEAQAKRQRKTKSLTEAYEALSGDQRKQVEVLVQEKRRDEPEDFASWEIAAIHRETVNNLRTRVRETAFIRVILTREDKRRAESKAVESRVTNISASSDISDLDNPIRLSHPRIQLEEQQDLSPQVVATRKGAKTRRSTDDVVEILSDPSSNIDTSLGPFTPSMDYTPSPKIWEGQVLGWDVPSQDQTQRHTLDYQQVPWRMQQAIQPQQVEQSRQVKDTLTYMSDVSNNAFAQTKGIYTGSTQRPPILPEPLFQERPPPGLCIPKQRFINSSVRQYPTKATRHEPSTCQEPRDYFGNHVPKPYEKQSFFETQSRRMNEASTSDYHCVKNLGADGDAPPTDGQITADSDWPDYNPAREQVVNPLPQQAKQETQNAERIRREDILFWRTQAHLSHSRSSSSLDDQSSILASPQLSSPPTSISGDRVPLTRRYTDKPVYGNVLRNGEGNDPGRFGQQLAAQGSLRPNQEHISVTTQWHQKDHKVPAWHEFDPEEDLSLRMSTREQPNQHMMPPTRLDHNSGAYIPDIHQRPYVPEPPEPKPNAVLFHSRQYQQPQDAESENTSMLQRLSERLDHMKLRHAEDATRQAAEAARKRRDLERKEAYEQGVEDAMGWKQKRPGTFGGYA